MTALKASLPRYYLPARAVRKETLPMTPNGKTDRNALAKE